MSISRPGLDTGYQLQCSNIGPICDLHSFQVITDRLAGPNGMGASWEAVPSSLRAYIWPREQGQGHKLKTNSKSIT